MTAPDIVNGLFELLDLVRGTIRSTRTTRAFRKLDEVPR